MKHLGMPGKHFAASIAVLLCFDSIFVWWIRGSGADTAPVAQGRERKQKGGAGEIAREMAEV